MRKPIFCICKNKDADQLRSNCAADQRLCFPNTDGTIPLRSKSEILSFQLSTVAAKSGCVGPGRKLRGPVFSHMQIFCICKNKEADQLRSNCAAVQRLCFRNTDLSLVMRKPFFCICENKDADQLRSSDQRLCFCNTDCTIPLLSKSEILSF